MKSRILMIRLSFKKFFKICIVFFHQKITELNQSLIQSLYFYPLLCFPQNYVDLYFLLYSIFLPIESSLPMLKNGSTVK